MSKLITYILQDWKVNHEGNSKSRFILVMFRSAQILGGFSAPFSGFSIFYRILYNLVIEWILGVELPRDTQVGPNLKLLHGQALVVNHETIIGANCTLRHSTTIGNKKLPDGSCSGSPKIGNNVDIGSNVVILGPITVGDNAIIGAGSVVVKDVPEGAVVVGNPARVIRILNTASPSLPNSSGAPKMPKVSVVIPAYNAMTYLPETLDSVLRQTFTDVEVLIINDGSSDQIVQWVSQVQDPRVKLISQENQGLPGARNTGIAHAQGEYIAFLDADDLWEPTKLEKQVHCLENKPAVGLVYAWTVLVDERGNPTGRIFISHAEGNVWEQIVWDDIISNGSTAMVRRGCFETVGVFDPNLRSAEDRDMWIRIASRYPFAVVKEPLVLYRQHPNSMTKNRKVMIQELRTVIEKSFQSAPLELLYLRNRSYGRMNLFQAWNSIDERNYKEAVHFRRQALLHHPQLRYSQNYIRLSLAIAMMRWFGPQAYDGVRVLTRALRRRMLGIET